MIKLLVWCRQHHKVDLQQLN